MTLIEEVATGARCIVCGERLTDERITHALPVRMSIDTHPGECAAAFDAGWAIFAEGDVDATMNDGIAGSIAVLISHVGITPLGDTRRRGHISPATCRAH